MEEIPLLEFDSNPRALMDPSRHRKPWHENAVVGETVGHHVHRAGSG